MLLKRIIIGVVVILLAVVTVLSLLVGIAAAERLAPHQIQAVSPGYQVYTDFIDAVIIIPPTTSDIEDREAIASLVSKIHQKGKDARITICSSRSQVFDSASDCVAIIYFRK